MTASIDMQALQDQVRSFSAEQLLAWAAQRFAGRVAIASSLGVEDQVLVEIIFRNQLAIPVFTIDTGRLPQETHDLLDATRQRYGLQIEVLVPDRADLEPLLRRRGSNFFRCSVEDRRLCCHVRKVLPLRRRLAGMEAWITGLRREQASSRQGVATLEWDHVNGLVKINPLADWSAQEVWAHVREHDVPYSVLHDRGYASIGCAPCTREVAPGQDARSGRWWWESSEHKECGLHPHRASGSTEGQATV